MELNNIYLDENILYNIIKNLNLNDKMMFCKSNKKIYNIFYKDIKYDIYDSLNDYKLYREFMRRFEYNKYHLECIGILVLENMKTIWINYNEYYDLRFIYECILQNLDTNNKIIKNSIKNDNIKLLLSVLDNCKSFNRFETQLKVNMEPCLLSIHSNYFFI
tara:strand:- start:475 stop:957 length:483 start_codon:yes stop_codon:yes gene_type:complete